MFNSILNNTLKTSIAHRWLIVACAILVTVWGVFSVTQMPLDVFPEFAPPQVEIQTEAIGLAPEEIEAQITVPVESAVNGLPGVTTVRRLLKSGFRLFRWSLTSPLILIKRGSQSPNACRKLAVSSQRGASA